MLLKIIKTTCLIIFVFAMGIVFYNIPPLIQTTTAYAESQEQTQLNVRDLCLDGYKWKVFIGDNGRIINVEQVLDRWASGSLNLVECTSNPKDVKVIKK